MKLQIDTLKFLTCIKNGEDIEICFTDFLTEEEAFKCKEKDLHLGGRDLRIKINLDNILES